VFLVVCAALALSEDAKHRLAVTTPPQHGGKTVSLMLVGSTGISATVTTAGGGDASDHLGSLSLMSRRAGFAYDRGLDVRASNFLELGAGVHDGGVVFHGGFGFDLAGGYRFHVAETHGPFIRGGFEALIVGDALVYQSLLELPQAQLGYQYLAGTTLLEAAGRSGFSMFGRSDTGYHANRHLDQVLDVGAMATAKTGPLLLAAEWSHFLARGDGGAPIDWLTVSLCGIVHKVAVCTDARMVAGDVFTAANEPTASHVTQVGLTVGSSSY
jgi:hypothetical protein